MSRHQSSPIEQLLGLLFSASTVLVTAIAMLYRISYATLQDSETKEDKEQKQP